MRTIQDVREDVQELKRYNRDIQFEQAEQMIIDAYGLTYYAYVSNQIADACMLTTRDGKDHWSITFISLDRILRNSVTEFMFIKQELPTLLNQHGTND